jgi:hypothetical protein
MSHSTWDLNRRKTLTESKRSQRHFGSQERLWAMLSIQVSNGNCGISSCLHFRSLSSGACRLAMWCKLKQSRTGGNSICWPHAPR